MLVAVEAHQKERACCVVALCQVNLPYRYALVCFIFFFAIWHGWCHAPGLFCGTLICILTICVFTHKTMGGGRLGVLQHAYVINVLHSENILQH